MIIKEIRLSRGFTQKRLAISIDSSQASIAKFESGALSIPLEVLIKISYFFGESLGRINEQAELYAMWLEYFHNYSIYLEKLPQGKDDLFALANEFYKSDKNISEYITSLEKLSRDVMRFPVNYNHYAINKSKKDTLVLANVFRYITNESFRNGKVVEVNRFYSQVIYEEIDDFEKIKDFFSDEKIYKNREDFLNKVKGRSMFITHPLDHYVDE